VRITVADEGICIAAPWLPSLYERYTAARRFGQRGEPVMGLGLWLRKTIVDLHKGTLRVRSTEGQGSTFTVELPV
jgi:two-component system sensor histidine kinase VicK